MQQVTGTTRPEHGDHHTIIIELNGFTKPARNFAEKYNSLLSAIRV
ncbi:hypothetical protein AB0D97_32075 [Streptomyces roseus]